MTHPIFQEFKNDALSDPEEKAEYKSLALAYELRKSLIAIRKMAGLTQADMAEMLSTQKSNISRLENVNSKSSPRLSTIEEYAKAAGYNVKISFEPESA